VSSIINIAGLSLGITGCLVIFLIVRHEMSFDTFHADKERIYRLVSERERQGSMVLGAGMLDPMLVPLRDEITGAETIAITYAMNDKVRITDEHGEKYFEATRFGIDPFEIVVTDPAWFDIFRYEWLAGSPAALNEPFMVVLTEKKAMKYFGDMPADAYIGQTVTYGNALNVMVAGIVKSWGKNTDFAFTDFISYASVPGSELNAMVQMNAWGNWKFTTQVYMKLFAGVEPATVEAQFPAWAEKYVWMPPGSTLKLSLQPLADIHFNTNAEGDYLRPAHLPTLYGLMGIAVFILIIAACNFINLSTAQSLQRTKEIGVRKVLGGKRKNLIMQLLGETLLVTLFAALFSIVLARMMIDAFHSFVPQGLSLGLAQPFTWLFLLAVVLFTTLLAGF
jgi:hypothetical protein